MILLLAIFSVVHSLFFISIFIVWKSIREQSIYKDHKGEVSIIIPFRNESDALPILFECFSRQHIEGFSIEFIFIDDHSIDDSLSKCRDFAASCAMDVRVLELPAGLSGKKQASTLGVKSAKYPVILCTDADCRPGPLWISTMVRYMKERNLSMVTGPVCMTSGSFFQKLQAVEFSGLIAYGASSLHLNIPGMCNGANMAYLKDLFIRVKGYEGNQHIASGDDEFLLQKVFKESNGAVEFVKNQEAIVYTNTKRRFKSLINQRKRWTSKWKSHDSIFIKTSAMMVFLDSILGLLNLLLISRYPSLCITLLLIRILSELVFLRAAAGFFDIKRSFFAGLMISIIYPIYVLFLGIASIFGDYKWKGRLYR